MGMARTEVRIDELQRLERFRVYLGCYWRALLYVVAQILVMVPVTILLTIEIHSFPGNGITASQWARGGVVELLSMVIGFLFVASFLRLMLRVRLGRVRLALIIDNAP